MADSVTGRPRIETVAQLAGTSPITVSRALRRPEKVAASTRARIAAAIEQLGYIPNLSASSLASRRSGIVAVLVPTLGHSLFAETLRGISETVAAAGLQILLGDYAYSTERERALLRALAGRQPEAVVTIGLVQDAAQRALLAALGGPVVETWDLTPEPIDTVIGFSNEAAGAAVARHFLAGGRRRLAFAGGADLRAAARLQGFAAAIAEAGAAPPCVVKTSDLAVGAGRVALTEILESDPACDAIFLANDVVAAGAVLEARDRGIAIPGRLAICGLGDLEIGRAIRPVLTTVNVDAYDIGRRAGQVVVDRLSGTAVGARVIDVGCSIIVRESG
jgi:LacI family gluconate utilization system Gnt-I transcriptional repressor